MISRSRKPRRAVSLMDYLEANPMSKRSLARRAGVPHTRVNRILMDCAVNGSEYFVVPMGSGVEIYQYVPAQYILLE